ncbi:hypothetical protein PP178_04170 [Zeaxanthinibacter sp. PT1]|uniref:hypothetical protein n=1 Tax=Zeaxanthinibacter TaxID=561554 RepID=UPI00234BAF40|nr:hypothetical protein [Zeaxanthinibacter sp. PT1]MDC6350737.1 hypothetical protein [Zeaxanthinibacter sp. PT1]
MQNLPDFTLILLAIIAVLAVTVGYLLMKISNREEPSTVELLMDRQVMADVQRFVEHSIPRYYRGRSGKPVMYDFSRYAYQELVNSLTLAISQANKEYIDELKGRESELYKNETLYI